jgi:hypothetical protein
VPEQPKWSIVLLNISRQLGECKKIRVQIRHFPEDLAPLTDELIE